MFRKWKLATVIAVALSTVGTIDSAEAHIGGRGGGIRIGGGLIPRGRQPGNANGNRIAGRTTPAPKVATPQPATPPVVPIGGTNSSSMPLVKSAITNTNKPSNGTVISNNSAIKSPKVQAPVPAQEPVNTSGNHPGLLVFSLTGNAVPEATTDAPAVQPTGLSAEAKQALAEALAADAPAAASAPAAVSKEVTSKEVALPKIPVGATVTLNGKDLSDKEGQVVLQIGDIALPATITAWKNNMVTCTLPVLGLTKASKATLHVLNADGKTASLLNCELVIALPPR